jgi:hypothetical protein
MDLGEGLGALGWLCWAVASYIGLHLIQRKVDLLDPDRKI